MKLLTSCQNLLHCLMQGLGATGAARRLTDNMRLSPGKVVTTYSRQGYACNKVPRSDHALVEELDPSRSAFLLNEIV